MTALPASIDFTDSAVTEGDFKTAITNQRDYLNGLLGDDGVAATALQTLGAFANEVSAKSANYTVLAVDRGTVFNCTGTLTLSLTAAVTLGNGFVFAVINSGTGTITVDPNSTELIDGASTIDIVSGQWAIISCTGTEFVSIGAIQSSGKGVAVITSSGTWPVPDGVTSAIITVVGGGGGGASGTSGLNKGGNGGFATAYCIDLDGDLTITIGNGGYGDESSNADTGGTSSVVGTNVSISATGGQGARFPSGTASNGTGTVSVGTFLASGTAQSVRFPSLLSGSSYTSGKGTPIEFSLSSSFGAGAGGLSSVTSNTETGGVGGAVLIEW